MKSEWGKKKMLLKEEVGEKPAVRHPPAGVLRENHHLWGYQMTPAFQGTHEPVEAIQTALWQGRPSLCDRPCQDRAALVSYRKPSLTSSFSNFRILFVVSSPFPVVPELACLSLAPQPNFTNFHMRPRKLHL